MQAMQSAGSVLHCRRQVWRSTLAVGKAIQTLEQHLHPYLAHEEGHLNALHFCALTVTTCCAGQDAASIRVVLRLSALLGGAITRS